MLLQTERLIIRLLSLADKVALFEIYSDKEAMRYRGSKPFETMADVYEMLDQTFRKINAKQEFRYAVELKTTKELIGTLLIKPIADGVCEIGFSFGKNYWSKGYGQELLKAVFPYLKVKQYKKVIASSRKENLASNKLMLNVGFTQLPDINASNLYFFEYVIC